MCKQCTHVVEGSHYNNYVHTTALYYRHTVHSYSVTLSPSSDLWRRLSAKPVKAIIILS